MEMVEMNLAEKATRYKYRFPSVNGDLTMEALWGLPLSTEKSNRASLNDVAKTINRQLKDEEEESFVGEPSANTTMLREKLEIVKRIIEVRKHENVLAVQRSKDRERLETINRLIEQKELETLEAKDIEALKREAQEIRARKA